MILLVFFTLAISYFLSLVFIILFFYCLLLFYCYSLISMTLARWRRRARLFRDEREREIILIFTLLELKL